MNVDRRLCLAMLATSCFLFSTAPVSEDEPLAHPSLPANAPVFQRVDADELAQFIERPSAHGRIVNFWATWCGPCKAEMPEIASVATATPEVELWFVNLDHPQAAQARLDRFLEDTHISSFHHLRPREDEQDVTRHLTDWPDVLPVTLLVAPDGSRARRWVGAINRRMIQDALDEASATADDSNH